MRLAFISSLVPEREPRSGFAVANRAVVDGLAALGHDVVSIGAKQDDASEPHGTSIVLETLNVENAHASSGMKARWGARAVAGGMPFAAAKLRTIGERRVRAAVAEAAPEGVVLNSYQMACAFPWLREPPFVYLAHNVEARTAAQNAKAASGAVARAMYARDAKILKRAEREFARTACHVWCLSDGDREAFAAHTDRVSTLPLLFPEVATTAPPATRPFDAVLIGTWTWEANAVGLRWFVSRVVPLLPLDMRIAVAGSVPADLDLSDGRLVAMGRVESAEGFLAQGHVVPLVARGGTGIQLKTIETFQRGLATVATASAVRGIANVPENCTVADEPEGFARALIEKARAARNGSDLAVDPAAWTERQRSALLAGLSRGVADLG